MISKKWQLILAQTLFFYGLLVWLYVIAMQIAHPESVSWTFTEWLRLRMDLVGETAFIGSVIGFMAWQWLRK